MKRTMIGLLALLLMGKVAQATPYFRLLDPNHLQLSAGFLISPKNPADTAGVTELALITHSTEDGTIIPASWQKFIPPEAWTPLQVGVGGSFNKDLIFDLGTSFNLSPVLANAALGRVGSSSSPFLRGLKVALLGSGTGQIRLGYAIEGKAFSNGAFNSFGAMFPGRGFGQIIGNASRIDTGVAWKF